MCVACDRAPSAAFACIEGADYRELKPDCKPERLDVTIDMHRRVDVDPTVLPSVWFSDEAMLQQS